MMMHAEKLLYNDLSQEKRLQCCLSGISGEDGQEALRRIVQVGYFEIKCRGYTAGALRSGNAEPEVE